VTSLYERRAEAWRAAEAQATTDLERQRAAAQADEYDRLARQAQQPTAPEQQR